MAVYDPVAMMILFPNMHIYFYHLRSIEVTYGYCYGLVNDFLSSSDFISSSFITDDC